LKIAIIGAGASGCFAAANIPYHPSREVVVFEKTGKPLQKVKISGGGRCNVTHHLLDVPSLVQRYPRGKNLLKKTLHRFSPADTIVWFESRKVLIKAEADGRMFPTTNQSQTIIDCIWLEMQHQQVTVLFHKSVVKIEKGYNQFTLTFQDGSNYTSDVVLVACGGFPKLTQYQWLQDLNHSISSPVPSLFTFNLPKHSITSLMGVSVSKASVKLLNSKIAEQGPVLITHWGLSGPAILRTSAWGAKDIQAKNYEFSVRINWLGEVTEHELKEHFNDKRKYEGTHFINDRNDWELPKRLWEYLLHEAGIVSKVKWGELKTKQQQDLIELLIRHHFEVKGKTTYKDEFVTCGGVELSEINPETMESKKLPGLYFTGEVMNVDGITGGFNFQHAWSSAWIFAQNFQST
jgi:hypothetical protein